MPTYLRILSTLASVTLLLGCPGTPPPPPPAPHIVAFTASPDRVAPGGTVTLSWDATNATRVELQRVNSGVVAGAENPRGSVDVSLEADALFVLVATNENGVSDTATAWVEVDDGLSEVLFVASPMRVHAGQKTLLTWHAPGATRVSLAPKGGAPLALGGSLEHGAIEVRPTLDTTFVLTANGKSFETTVQVDPGILEFEATPRFATAEQPVTVSWKTLGAKKVTLTLGNVGEVLSETDAAKVADGSFTYSLPALVDPATIFTFELRAFGAGPDSVEVRALEVAVSGTPKIWKWQVPEYALIGGSYLVSWETTGADGLEILQDGAVVHRSSTPESVGSGSYALPTPPADTKLKLRIFHSRGGEDVSEELPVRPVGLPTLNAFAVSPLPGIAHGGDPVTLTWDAPNARDLKIVAGNQFIVYAVKGVQAAAGSVELFPNKDTTYQLFANNGVRQSVTSQPIAVTVGTPAGITFSPKRVPPGAQVAITGTTIPGAGDLYAVGFPLKNQPGDAFIDISTTGTAITFPNLDTGSKVITLPEPFQFEWAGLPVGGRKISIAVNGWMGFSDVAIDGPGFPTDVLPNTQYEPNALVPYGENLSLDTDSSVVWQVDGTGDQLRLIVQWNNLLLSGSPSKRVTFQARLYANGELVFAYKALTGLTTLGDRPAIGIISADEAGAFKPLTTQVDATNTRPSPGDTLRFFAKLPLPFTLTASTDKLSVAVVKGSGRTYVDDVADLVGPGLVSISEAMVNPSAGVSLGEWFELTNTSSSPFDLEDFVIDFGNGSTLPFTAPLIVPANGRILLGQASTSAGGATVVYVYGPGFTLPKVGGALKLNVSNVTYSALNTGAGIPLPGYAVQRGQIAAGVTKATSVTETVCTAPSTASSGTPGASNPTCPSYAAGGVIPGAFEALETSGGTKIVPSGTVDNSLDAVALPVPVRFGALQYSAVYVSTNGFVTLEPLTCGASANCYANNPNGINSTDKLPTGVGAIAPFWDDLTLNPGGGIYWARRADYTVISWENATRTGTDTHSLNFQIKFFDTGAIEFHYGVMTGGGSVNAANYTRGLSATSWLEMPQGTAAFVINVNLVNPGINATSGYRFNAL